MDENEELRGAERMNAAIKNQRDAGEGEFHLPFEEAFALMYECRAEAIRGYDDLVDLKEDLGVYEENPPHYQGDGTVSCARAMRSMLEGWQRGAGGFALTKDDIDFKGCMPLEAAYWATSAFKYLWRFPLKGHPGEDLAKALDCCQKALDAWEDGDE